MAFHLGILAGSEAEVHARAQAQALERPDADLLAVRVGRLVPAGLNPVLGGKADGGLAGVVEEHARFHHAVQRLRLGTRLQQPGDAQAIVRGLAPRALASSSGSGLPGMNLALGIDAHGPFGGRLDRGDLVEQRRGFGRRPVARGVAFLSAG